MTYLSSGLRLALYALVLCGVANAADQPSQPVAATVRIAGFAYHPESVTVHAGDLVTFVNDDDEAHTVTAADRSFDSEGLDGAATWRHVFAKPGTFHYFCELHPYMRATIVVLPRSHA